MKRTQQILMTVFVLLCLVSAGLYLMYTFLPESMPVLHVSDETRFTTTSVFILLTLATIPFSLRLFKFKGIARDLHTRKAPALLKWGLIRMVMIGDLLVFNILFYYLFEEEPTGIENVMKDGNVKMENGCVAFSGLDAGSAVSVYQQDGRLIKDSKADADGNAIVELSGMPKGVLIIHSNKTDIKIINR